MRGGILQQDSDNYIITEKDLKVVTNKAPDTIQILDLFFAWNVCKVTRSNAVAIVSDEMLVAGGGARIACAAARLRSTKPPRAKGSAAASDGFFPFADGPSICIAAGVTRSFNGRIDSKSEGAN